jgi:preprotein translocase SecE subunit
VAIQIYKSGQGRYVRVSTAVGVGIVLLILAWYTGLMLERHLPGGTGGARPAPTGQKAPAAPGSPGTPASAGAAPAPAAEAKAPPYKVYLVYGIPAVMFAALAVVAFFYMNKPVVVDFFIATESEMKKVSWSSRAELLGSTAVVLVTVFLLALFIWLADTGIIWSLTRGLGLW